MPIFRRFSQFPGLDVLGQIESINIVDLPPPGVFLGIEEGVVCLVGEWAKGLYNAPTEVTGDDTIRSGFGGFSISLSDPLNFATLSSRFSNGCSFAWLKGLVFSDLVLARVDMRLTGTVTITVTDNSANSQNGAKTIAISGTTVTMTDPNANFQPYVVGRNIVTTLFTNGGNNGTFPITAVLSSTQIQFTNAGGVAEVSPVGATWVITDPLAANLTIPGGTRVRDPGNLTHEFALASDVIIALGTDLSVNATSVFTESGGPGSQMVASTTRQVSGVPVFSTQGVAAGGGAQVTQVDSGDLARAGIGAGTPNPSFVVAVTNPGALTPLTGAQIDANYTNALNSTLPGGVDPAAKINVIASARQSQAIRAALNANAVNSSASGTGRVAVVRPPIGTTPATAEGNADPGVGANRADRVVYCYPHFLKFVPEIPLIDPTQTGQIFIGADSLMSMLMSNLAPEENPAQDTGLLTMVLGLEPGLTGAGLPTNFQLQDYINFKAGGIAALTKDSHSGDWLFQSGVTSVLLSTSPALAPINRRRFTDFLEDSFARIAGKYDKKLATNRNKVALLGEITDFLETLLSPNNDAQQRLAQYEIDSQSGNTPKLAAAGIYVLIVEVTELASLDSIVFQVQAGAGVVITSNPGT